MRISSPRQCFPHLDGCLKRPKSTRRWTRTTPHLHRDQVRIMPIRVLTRAGGRARYPLKNGPLRTIFLFVISPPIVLLFSRAGWTCSHPLCCFQHCRAFPCPPFSSSPSLGSFPTFATRYSIEYTGIRWQSTLVPGMPPLRLSRLQCTR